MASYAEVVKYYPEFVTNIKDNGKPGFKPKCDTSTAARVKFPKQGGGYYNLIVHPKTVEAWTAYVALMEKYGQTVPPAGGTFNCRNIGGKDQVSTHALGIALDLPPNSRKTAEFQAAVLKVKTKSGAVIFKNLASINDRMHDEITASPAALASGVDWKTVGTTPQPQPTPTPKPPSGDTELPMEAVKGIQRALNAAGYLGANKKALTVDGEWGANTEFAFTTMTKERATGAVDSAARNAAAAAQTAANAAGVAAKAAQTDAARANKSLDKIRSE